MSQKEFRIALSRELVDNQTFRKRSFQTMPKHITKKKKRVEESDERQKRLYGVPEEVRYQKLEGGRRRGRGRRRPATRLQAQQGAEQPGDAISGAEDSEDEEEPEPAPVARHQPTANLLGWRRPTPLNKNQLSNLRRIIDDVDDFQYTNDRYRIHTRLFEFVFNKLRESRRYKLLPLPKATTGSVAQQMAWMPDESITDRNSQHISGQGRVVSRTNVPTRIVTAARVMCYRVIREQIDERHAWACLYWDRYRNTPAAWARNRNTYLVRGSSGLFEWTSFSTAIEDRSDAVTEFLNKFKTKG
ncbi:hypothetical protein PYW08_006156 [Mythimna loreyi]|uniref:Uncharacterized protein n=1 Tax=Mythimna loreyi TaxID=667449 RepID=A0ACC2QNY5_9NEOP|nr:hypothetical protein PYW08_006156 [Mythimna loreyi]